MKNVVLNFKSIQQVGDQRDVIEFMSVAEVEENEKGIVLTYEENITDNQPGVHSKVAVNKDGSVCINRSGGFGGELFIEQGKRHLCSYVTPYGDMTIGIFGDYVKSNIIDGTGNLEMQYSIDVNSGLLSKNKVEIRISEE